MFVLDNERQRIHIKQILPSQVTVNQKIVLRCSLGQASVVDSNGKHHILDTDSQYWMSVPYGEVTTLYPMRCV